MRGLGARTLAASTLAELTTLFRTPERGTHRSTAEVARAARALLRTAFLIPAVALIAQGALLLAAAGALGRLTYFLTPVDLRRVAHDPAWVNTGVVAEIRGEVFLVASVLAMLSVVPAFAAWLGRAFANALGSDVSISPERAVLRALGSSAGSTLILLLALSFGTGWSRAVPAIVLAGAGFVVTSSYASTAMGRGRRRWSTHHTAARMVAIARRCSVLGLTRVGHPGGLDLGVRLWMAMHGHQSLDCSRRLAVDL